MPSRWRRVSFFANAVDRSKPQENLGRLERHHAADGDVAVPHLLELLRGVGVGLGAPALRDSQGFER